MSAATMAGDNRLAVLAADIQAAHRAIQASAMEMAERAIAAGHALIEAKKLIPHGGWGDWLRAHAGMSERTARRYMQIARSGMKTATVADLGIRAAAEALAGEAEEPLRGFEKDCWVMALRLSADALPSVSGNPEDASSCLSLAERMILQVAGRSELDRMRLWLSVSKNVAQTFAEANLYHVLKQRRDFDRDWGHLTEETWDAHWDDVLAWFKARREPVTWRPAPGLPDELVAMFAGAPS